MGTGANSKAYTVPKALLCKISWFDRALRDGRLQEGITGHINLPNYSPDVFEAFQYRLYHQDLAFRWIDTAVPGGGDDDEGQEQLELCCGIWIFGDKYGIPTLQNAAMLRACELFVEANVDFPPELAEMCYNSTAIGPPLRKLVGDHVVFNFLGRYGGFLNDLYAAKGAYDKHAKRRLSRKLSSKGEWPRFLKPYRNEDLFEISVDAESMKEIPYTSHAVGYPTQPGTYCQECGNHGADMCCGQGINGFNRTCMCGNEDHMQLRGFCVD